MKKRLLSLALTLALTLALCPVLSIQAGAASLLYINVGGPSVYNWTSAEWEKTGQAETGLQIFSVTANHSDFLEGWEGTIDVYGLKDSAGNIVFPARYTAFFYYDGKVFAADAALTIGVFTPSGTPIFTRSSISCIEQLSNGFYKITHYLPHNVTEYGLYDESFHELIPYTDCIDIRPCEGTYGYNYRVTYEGFYLFVAYSDNDDYARYGLYKYGTGVVIPAAYREMKYLGEGRFFVRRPDMYCGVLDETGKTILPFQFANITGYQAGCYTVNIFRSPEDYQLALESHMIFQPDSNLLDYHGIDVSDRPSYSIAGIIDENLNALTDFRADCEIVAMGTKDTATLHAWNGGHEWRDLYQGGGYPYYGKSYDSQTVELASLTPTGKTVADLLRERGVSSGQDAVVTTLPTKFTDVAASSPFVDAINWAVDQGITSGKTATTFAPSENCTTGQILTFLWRAAGSPEPVTDNPFTDSIPASYQKAAVWAYEQGLVSGTTLGASTPCTRAATVTYLWQLAGSPAASTNTGFSDVPADAEYAQAVAWAVENSITSGTGGGQFSPDATCTRGQIVTFLYRAMGK